MSKGFEWLIISATKFFSLMIGKLFEKERIGWTGWDSMEKAEILTRLQQNITAGDWVDVANFAMMLWVRGE